MSNQMHSNQIHLQDILSKHYSDGIVVVTDPRGDDQHLHIQIESNAFSNKSTLARHREVMAVIKERLESFELHAVSLKLIASKN